MTYWSYSFVGSPCANYSDTARWLGKQNKVINDHETERCGGLLEGERGKGAVANRRCCGGPPTTGRGEKRCCGGRGRGRGTSCPGEMSLPALGMHQCVKFHFLSYPFHRATPPHWDGSCPPSIATPLLADITCTDLAKPLQDGSQGECNFRREYFACQQAPRSLGGSQQHRIHFCGSRLNLFSEIPMSVMKSSNC